MNRDKERRVVLVKPGDVLLIGNVGVWAPAELQPVIEAFQRIDLKVAFFQENIYIDTLTPEQIDALKELSEHGATRSRSSGGQEDQPGPEVPVREPSVGPQPGAERTGFGDSADDPSAPVDRGGYVLRDRRSAP